MNCIHFRARGMRVLVCLAALVVASSHAVSAQKPGTPKTVKPAARATVQAVMLSDIHFEPFHDPAKLPLLRKAPVGDWQKILAEPDAATQAADFAKLQRACKTRGTDTPWTLLEATLSAAHENAPHAAFVTVSGDLLSHSFDCRFKFLAPGATEQEYTEFTEKTEAYIASELRRAFPHTPVYIGLGNNDSGCADYKETVDSPFLHSVAESFAPMLDSAADEKVLLHIFPANGGYTVTLPKPIVRGKLIVLQDIFQSREYGTCGGAADKTAAAAQIDWLRNELAAARLAHEQVWVMAHIPPGVNVYSTISHARDVCSTAGPEMFLANEKLAEALTDFGDVVRLGLFGHTHMDEIHLLEPDAKNVSKEAGAVPLKLVPAVSPVNGNNPSFTLAEVDPASARLMDYRVIAGSNQTGIGAAWSEEYDYAQTYHLPDFSAASVHKLLGELAADHGGSSEASRAYQHDFFVGGAGGGSRGALLSLVWPAYVCGMEQNTVAGYRSCVCTKKP